MKARNIGIKVKQPSKSCEDNKCPFHGAVKVRGRTFTGVVVAKDTHKTATVEWSYRVSVPKYERTETRRTKIHVHNPPCINAEIWDIVKIAETRPLSKTKNFVIIENLGKEKGFEEKLGAIEEAKEIIEKKGREEKPKEKETEEESKEEEKIKEENESS